MQFLQHTRIPFHSLIHEEKIADLSEQIQYVCHVILGVIEKVRGRK